jgi:hypothetical protein
MIYLLAFAAIYYLIGLVGSYKLGMATDPTISPVILSIVSVFWPIALFFVYCKAASK